MISSGIEFTKYNLDTHYSMSSYPKLLVISNNSFSKQNSNGRTLGSLIQGWPKDRVAQFCISSDGADFEVCENYFCVTDGDVLKSTLSMISAKRRDLKTGEKVDSNNKNGYRHFKKTPFRMFLRNWAWDLGFWKGKEFYTWIEDFNPDVILLQNGESYFMHNLAMRLGKKYNIPLLMFNTEGYYFFRKPYFPISSIIDKILFKLYRNKYNRKFEKFMYQCTGTIYGNNMLETDYKAVFPKVLSTTIYTGSNLRFKPLKATTKPKFSYLGNMGYNRPKILMELAQILQEINPEFILDVYGPPKSLEMERVLKEAAGINYHGVVTYSKVVDIIEQSNFLVHTESQEEEFRESLKYGFSTKIADSIASGKILILYSSPDIACAQYVQQTGAGIFSSYREELKNKIIQVLNGDTYNSIVEKAKVASNNHDLLKNSHAFSRFIIESLDFSNIQKDT